MKLAILKEYVDILIEREYLRESKQQIVNLGIPPVIAGLLFEKFGNKAMVVAKWFKSYKNTNGYPDDTWWARNNVGRLVNQNEIDLKDLIHLYNAAESGNKDAYLEARKDAGLALDPNADWRSAKRRSHEEILANLDLSSEMKMLKTEINAYFFEDGFFRSKFMKDFLANKIPDVKPYSRLDFKGTQDKYDKKFLFTDQEPLKIYPNGWRWIDAGPNCQLIGGLMKNCGSTGVMSSDPDRTMLTLFDEKNKPHVVVTYSPNQKRISGDEGQGSSAVKSEYQEYVFDIAKHLGVPFDFENSKSTEMKLKWIFQGHLKSIEEPFKTSSYPIYRVTLDDGKVFWGNHHYFLEDKDIRDAANEERVDLSSEESLHRFVSRALNSRDYPLKSTHELARVYNPGGIRDHSL